MKGLMNEWNSEGTIVGGNEGVCISQKESEGTSIEMKVEGSEQESE